MSSLKDLASLIMVPSLVKDGRLDTVKPLGNSILHPDATGNNDGTDGSTPAEGNFTFSRGSNLAATRVDVNGLIEKGRENLLVQSNNFGSGSWVNVNSSRTSGQTGYDGSSDAWLLSATSDFANVYQTITETGLVTFSVHAKAGTGNWMMMRLNGSNNNLIYVDLANQVFGGTSAQYVDGTITDLGSGWRRVSITINQTSYNNAHIYVAADDLDLNTTNETIYIQDAQLEQGLVATDYIETGASTAQAGILEDLPRLDYSGGASCPALLLEPQRSNLVTQSEYIGAWDNSTYPITIASNQIVSPSGNINASLLTPNSGNSRHAIKETISCSATTYTLSAFYKKANAQYVVLSDGGDASWHIVTADLNNGTITDETNATGTIESYGNDWYRITCTFTRTNATTIQIFIGSSPTDSNTSLPSFDNTSLTTYIWGVQLEEGSYPTSYIPTYGSAVTRGADFATKTGLTSLIDSTQGTMFLDFKALANTLPSEYSYFSMSDGTYNNRIAILQSIGGNNQVRVFAFVGGTKVFDMTGSITDITAQTKVALRYAENAFDLFINGVKASTDTSGAIFSADTLDRVSFSEIGTTAGAFKGKVNQALIFPTALTDSEAIALTTL